MKIIPCSLAALAFLCAHALPDEVAEYEAAHGMLWDADVVAAALFNRRGEKYLLVTDDGVPVVAGGFEPLCPGVFAGWMVGSPEGWGAFGWRITLGVRRLVESLFAGGAHRLEVMTLASRTDTCRWYMKALRMRFEGAHRGRGAQGETMVTYARTGEAR